MATSILSAASPHKTIPERVLERVREIAKQFVGVDDCWEWPQYRNPRSGYGGINCRVDGKLTAFTAHRASYTAFHGQIGPGLMVCHICDNRGCFNPSHLYLGTASDNARDMFERSRVDRRSHAARGLFHGSKTKPDKVQRGATHHASKLNEEIVRAIRSSKLSNYKLARIYGVKDATISAVRLGKTWAHVK